VSDSILFKCATPGMVGAMTYIRKTGDVYEARQAIAIFGDFQMKEKDLEKIEYDPFHDDFHDNFVSGKGDSEEAAIRAMKKDSEQMYESLWI